MYTKWVSFTMIKENGHLWISSHRLSISGQNYRTRDLNTLLITIHTVLPITYDQPSCFRFRVQTLLQQRSIYQINQEFIRFKPRETIVEE